MRILSHTLSASLLGLLVLSGCAKDDFDRDGFTTEEGDCDDQDPNISPTAADLVGDGHDQNCDGTDGVDADGDGWASEASGGSDCDDTDADSTIITEDGDCDGTLTADDCDDTDAESHVVAEDGDCDGTLTAADCDDADAESTIIAEDADCDGTLTADDCDDADAESTVIAEDQDCDGALTAEDCNDWDPLLNLADADSDGSTTCDGDCDDADATVESLDADGDGYSTCDDDCDDGNDSANPGATDGLLFDRDCDGVASGGSLSLSEYKLLGVEMDYAGHSVSSAGDVDGDGLDDLLIGAYGNDDGGAWAGAAYVVLGSNLGTSSTIDLSTADYKLVGDSSEDYAGTSVSSAGDVDGDGLDDLLIGARGDGDGGSNAGAAYIVLGSSLGTSSTIDLSTADYKLVGEDVWDYAGYSVSSAGDVDGDGLDDVLVGAPYHGGNYEGAVYVVLGSSLGTSSTIDLINADYKLVGEDTKDYAGKSVSSGGDVDGDGLADVLVGAYGNNDGGDSAGKAYLILGASLNGTSTIELSNADYSFVGENARDIAGYSVSSAGDVDGDGLDDLLVGAHLNDDGGDSAGKAYLILGASLSGTSTIDLSNADYSFVGENSGDNAGRSVSSAGDINGDGIDDLLLGGNRPNGLGAAYVVFGSSLSTSSTIDLSNADYKLVGESAGDDAGFSVSSAGDVDGDGLDDILVGAYDDGEGGWGAGAAYLILTGG
jgi:hypothetical protein